jgi:hypothetical protein
MKSPADTNTASTHIRGEHPLAFANFSDGYRPNASPTLLIEGEGNNHGRLLAQYTERAQLPACRGA